MADHYDVNDYLRIYRPTDGEFADELCISAHGGYKKSYGWADAPAGATVYFYEMHGATQKNQRSRQIMQGSNVRPTSIGCGQVWNYHLAMYELDSNQAPADVASSSSSFARDQAKADRGQETFGYALRDIVSIKQERLPKNLFRDGMSLQYIFGELDRTHQYTSIHLCFCRYQFRYRGNKKGKRFPVA